MPSDGNGDVEKQLLMAATEPVADSARKQQAKDQQRVDTEPDLLGPYILDRLCGRVECPRVPAEGEKFVPPVGPWHDLPEWCHVGAWSPLATTFFAVVFGLLCISSPFSLGETQREHMAATASAAHSLKVDAIITQVLLRALCGSYGLLLLAGMLKKVGWWPIITYTMISWTLLSLRLLFAAAAPFSLAAAWASELIRYTALLQTTVVVVVWWLVIVPLVLLLEKNATKRIEFWKWNWSFALINVHCLNLPVAAADFLNAPRALTPMDVWIVGAVTLAYVLFYTLFLDRKGIFLYFILTPRTHWCCVIYAGVLVLMGGMLWGWVRIGDCGFGSFAW